VIEKDGNTHKNEGIFRKDYYAFGKPVFSPCRGRIITMISNLPDNQPGLVDEANPWGNFIIMDTTLGYFVELSHFAQGSIRVQEGQWVEAGTQLGLCGNSGYSPQPHIHIQAQVAAWIGAATLPFYFCGYLDNYYGATLYYSRYPHSDVQVWQAIPNVGKYIEAPFGAGAILFDSKLYLITTDIRQRKNGYLSVAGKISWFYRAFDLDPGVWSGAQSYAVRDGGFTVYNLPEKHKAGVDLGIGYAIGDNTRLSLGIAREKVIKDISSADVDITTYRIVLKQRF